MEISSLEMGRLPQKEEDLPTAKKNIRRKTNNGIPNLGRLENSTARTSRRHEVL
jgi:hypothetical protein